MKTSANHFKLEISAFSHIPSHPCLQLGQTAGSARQPPLAREGVTQSPLCSSFRNHHFGNDFVSKASIHCARSAHHAAHQSISPAILAPSRFHLPATASGGPDQGRISQANGFPCRPVGASLINSSLLTGLLDIRRRCTRLPVQPFGPSVTSTLSGLRIIKFLIGSFVMVTR